jgi:dihydrofolate reductase
MRKVVCGLFISIDGVVESPDQWQFDVFDQDMEKMLADVIDSQDEILLGRVTYQEWVNYWPASKAPPEDDPFAAHINQTPKHVVSTTLDSVTWGDYDTISLLKDDVAETIAALKAKPGKNIGTAGSPTLVRRLLEQDLVDELVLVVYPVVAGKGKRLFDGWNGVKRLKLTNSQVTGSGVAILTYSRGAAV